MKIVSCDCFNTLSKNIHEGLGKEPDLHLMTINSETLENKTLYPTMYIKVDKEYIYMEPKFCPSCGKEIIKE